MGGGFLAGVQNAAGVVMEALQDDGVSEESDPVRRGGIQTALKQLSERFFWSQKHTCFDCSALNSARALEAEMGVVAPKMMNP